MDQLGAMRTFVEIVDQGSLSAAARYRQVSLPVVVRSLAALEQRLGVRLLNRTTRRISLTEAGAEFYQSCKHIDEAVAEAERAVSGQRHTPSGTLTLTAPMLFGRLHVEPLIGTFLARFPELSIELTLSDRSVDLIEDKVDVAVRIGHLPDSGLAAAPLAQTQRVLVASPAYLRKSGTPRTPEDLRDHNCLRLHALTPGRNWQFSRGGRDIGVRVAGRFASNSGDAVIQTALEDGGIACVLCYQVTEHLAAGRLRLVLQEFAPAPVPIQAVFANPQLLAAKVRTFVDYLKSSFNGRSFLPPQAQAKRSAAGRLPPRPRATS